MENCDSLLTLATDSIKMLHVKIAILDVKVEHGKIMQSMLGDLEPWQYASGFIFAVLGIFFMWLYTANKGRKNNPNTPGKWSWLHFFSMDNVITRVRTFILAVLTIYITFRFAEPIAQSNFSMFLAFMVGVSLDYFTDLIAGLKKKKDEALKPGSPA